ncbi:hypothetical protein HMPREF1608_04458 [Escherichia coli 908525]|nr:hypothetical protein HMPREF1608_04458 [Escherichia coli 908525]
MRSISRCGYCSFWFFDRGVSSFYFHFSSVGFSQITVCNTELVN